MNKQQLANKIWASANAMRAKIDANEYKDYILGLVFYKFLSDKEVNHLKSIDWTDEDLSDLKENFSDPDMRATIENCKTNIGYFISYDNLFSTWLKPESEFSVAILSGALSSFENMIAEEYRSVYGGIFKTLRSGLDKLGTSVSEQTKALKKLISLIRDVPTDNSQNYDVLGYIYEYLISKFAASAGKKAGEFYTPSEVAQLMSDIVAEHHRFKKQIEIYDPTSGSGSLLITIGKSIARHISDPNSIKYYAQELKAATYNLTRMNLVMRGISPSNIETRCADSLAEDWPIILHGPDSGKALRVDAVVSNPPYSQHWSNGDAEYDSRFKDFGVAPKSKADYAFLLHELHHLQSDGIMTIVLPHGVLFRGDPEDNAEGQIRARLIEKNHIDAIIGLPPNIFFGTGIPTLIMVLKQHRDNDDVLIIDASKCYLKGKQNVLRACDIKRISDAYRERKNISGFCRAVSRQEIKDNGYNLNIPRYVDSSEQPEQFDIYATVYGRIPNGEINGLNEYWTAFPSLRTELFRPELNKPYSTVVAKDVAAAIDSNKDVAALYRRYDDAFTGFSDWLHGMLIDNYAAVNSQKALGDISDEIFSRLHGLPLVDPYDAYQVLHEHWAAISGDLEMLQTEGLDAARVVEQTYKIVKTDDGEEEIPAGLEGRVIPFELIQREMFKDKLSAIKDLEIQRSETDSIIDELKESFDEDEAKIYIIEDTDKLNKALIKKDSKDKIGNVEPATLRKLKGLVNQWALQTKLNKELKEARRELEDATIEAITSLADELIVHFLHIKWIEPICSGIQALLPDRLSAMEKNIMALEAKYSMPYSRLISDLAGAQNEFADLVSDLTGDSYTLEGLRGLTNSTKY